ncbi:O-antigen ligase family protein [Selenomonas ruminantium]|uniref:O-antigen ligase family protein n=1 Tax=Selenomonas ruminantium TaxID=971 RepID=UPI00047AF285|nr:O-antigen ligase family protein [Selenomonas ruminantium]
MRKIVSRDSIEKRLYVYICLFAFMNIFSVAISNVFLGLAIAGTLHRLIRYHDDVKEILLRQKTFFCLVLVLWVTIVLSVPGSIDPARGIKEFFNYYVYRMMILPAVFLCVNEKKRVLNIALCMVAAMFINNIYSIVQGIEAYPIPGRYTGFMNVMPQASFLTVFIPASLVVFVGAQKTKLRWACMLFCLVACFAFMFNGTRGAWVATLVSALFLMSLQLKNKRNILVAILAAGVVLGGIYHTVPSFQQRVQSIANPQEQSNVERRLLWQSAWNMFTDHPLTGVGMANFKQNYQEHYILLEAKEPHLGHAHNNFMHVLAECGILGIVALSTLWGYLFIYGIKGWHNKKNPVFLLSLSVLVGVVLHGLTEYTWGTALTVKLFWLSMALCIKWVDLE